MRLSTAASIIVLAVVACLRPDVALGQSPDDASAEPSSDGESLASDSNGDGNDVDGDASSASSNSEDHHQNDENGETSDDADAETGDESGEVSGASNVDTGDDPDQGDPPSPESFDDLSSKERLRRAERAFGDGNFGRIPPLIEPLLVEEPEFDREERLIRARELFGVGLFFEAQQTTDPSDRDALMQKARIQFLELLRVRPDYELDSLIFPASVVELFETVRDENAEELASIRQARRQQSGDSAVRSGEATTLYVQRDIENRVYALNFFPFGVGQFQNNQPVKGALFAGGQLAALAVHAVGFWQIETLRQPNGYIRNPRNCACSDLSDATNWRRAQWAAVGVGTAIYLASALDATINYEPTDIQIRMLDEPPPELSSSDSSADKGPAVQLGFGNVTIRW